MKKITSIIRVCLTVLLIFGCIQKQAFTLQFVLV